jgi:hypothetical protein
MINVIILGEECRLLSCSINSFIQPPLISIFTGFILYSSLYFNTFNLCPSFGARDHVTVNLSGNPCCIELAGNLVGGSEG